MQTRHDNVDGCARACVFAVWRGRVSMCLCEYLCPQELIGTKYHVNIVITSSLWWVIALSWSMSACVDTCRGGSAPRTEFQSAPHKHLCGFWNVVFRMSFNFIACSSTMPNTVFWWVHINVHLLQDHHANYCRCKIMRTVSTLFPRQLWHRSYTCLR